MLKELIKSFIKRPYRTIRYLKGKRKIKKLLRNVDL